MSAVANRNVKNCCNSLKSQPKQYKAARLRFSYFQEAKK